MKAIVDTNELAFNQSCLSTNDPLCLFSHPKIELLEVDNFQFFNDFHNHICCHDLCLAGYFIRLVALFTVQDHPFFRIGDGPLLCLDSMGLVLQQSLLYNLIEFAVVKDS